MLPTVPQGTRTVPQVSLGLKNERLPPASLRLVSFVSPSASLPPLIDLRSSFPPVYDQGPVGSCTANAACGAVEYLTPTFLGSRLFLYYQSRLMDGDPQLDFGTSLSRAVQVLETVGMPLETEWPYDPSQKLVSPPASAYVSALNHKVLQAINIPVDLPQLKGCLAAGFPWIVGFNVYASFVQDGLTMGYYQSDGTWVKGTGVVVMPSAGEAVIGGHAVCVVGYDDANSWWIVRNSWGADRGDNGYFYFPYAYLDDPNIASDIWAIQLMSNGAPVDCVVDTSWTVGNCSATACGTTGTQPLTRNIVIYQSNNGAACPALTSTQACTAPACVLTPVDCVYSDWVKTDMCSATVCGTSGTQTFARVITTPSENNGAACPTNLSEVRSCSAAPCPILKPVNCEVTGWSATGTCSATSCGTTGTQTYSRFVTTPPQNNGAACPTTLSQTLPCAGPVCPSPVDCAVGPWGMWSDCSSSICGQSGSQTATRPVVSDAANGGVACPALTQTRPCINPQCHQVEMVVVGTVIVMIVLASGIMILQTV